MNVHANGTILYRLSVSLAEAHGKGLPCSSYNSKVHLQLLQYRACPFPTMVSLILLFLPLCSRLLNPSSDTVLRSCQFIHDVLLEDFPAEIFLQRSSIFKVNLLFVEILHIITFSHTVYMY